jgi:polygalacturonase
MSNFNWKRRELLRTGSLGAAFSAAPALALGVSSHAESTGRDENQGTYGVRSYGATGDGKTLDTQAVNRAIDAAALAGGGVVLFPAGLYLCFSVRLRSEVQLHLLPGSTLVAADSPKPGDTAGYSGGVYDAAEAVTPWDAYQDYGHNHWHNSLIWGEDLHNVSITGPGMIWGRGLSNGRDRAGGGSVFIAEQAGVGNKAIALKNCRNVIFRDFSVLKGGHFGLLLTGVDNLTIDNLKIDTDRDGIDIDCCQNVRVSNCTVNSPWDDGICPKSSYALGYARPTRNVTISNCWVTGDYKLGSVLDGSFKKFSKNDRVPRTGRVKCGTESNGGFINITISDCVFEGCQGYALESVDGALMEDITITNTTMRDLASSPLFLRLGSRLRGPKESTKVGTMRRIIISNLTCYNAPREFCSILSGIPGSSIEDVKLSDIFIDTAGGGLVEEAQIRPPEAESKYPEPNMFGPTPAFGFFLRHVRNIEMSHIDVVPELSDARPAFHLAHVQHSDFFAISSPRGAHGAFSLQDVTDFRIGWSRAAPDTVIDSVDSRVL